MARMMPCATKLRMLLNYDPATGLLTWKVSARRGYQAGDEAGTVRAGKGIRNPYRAVVIEGQKYFAQRLIWKIVTGNEPDGIVDHFDTDGLNNKWDNLREASNSQNGFNRRINRNNKSGIKGVHPRRGGWRAVITADKVVHRLGDFKNLADAEHAILQARQKLHGEFARAA